MQIEEDTYQRLNDANEWPAFIFKETNPIKEKWDLVILGCILYSAMVVPFRICFRADAEGALWVMEACISLLFMVDLVLSFRTAYLVYGEWVTDQRQIAKRYFSSWFWVDAPSSVPVEFIDLAFADSDSGSAGALATFRILRMLRLVRMLRLLKVGQYVARLEERLEVSLRGFRIVTLTLQIVFIAHLLACSWFLTTWIGDEPVTWIDLYDDGSA